jgi:apolipoprotein N-acyltransferase
MDRFAHAVVLSWGWRRRGIAFAAGAASALAQPPFFAFPLLWITFPTLVFLLDGAVAQGKSGRLRRLAPAFAAGWWFGFGYFLAGLWWVGAAFLVEADEFGWLMPFAVVALPAGLALFWGLGAACAQLFWSEDWRRIFALAAALGGAEWLRGHILGGFPWNAIGYTLTAGEILMQSAALFGVYGLGVLAVLVFAAPAALAGGASTRRRNVALPALGLAALAALGLHGAIRLAQADAAFLGDATVRIVQPALGQLQKWNPANRDDVLRTYYRLSAPEGSPLGADTLLVWPESAFPFALTQEPGVLAAIAELLPPGAVLATGAYRIEDLPSGERRTFNSIYVIGDDGGVLDAYDKRRLVPFGEYLPAAGLLARTGLRQLAWSGFSAGPRRRALTLPSGATLAPLICYEAIFPRAVLPEGERPDALLNVTNDGWFGRTIGPHQHFHPARVRAVEEGLPLIRAANTGISAIVDPYGRLLARAGLGFAATVEARLPAPIAPPFYARWGDIVAALGIAACLLATASRAVNSAYRL